MGNNAQELGLKNIAAHCGNNPYNAPVGSIVVVSAGALGTANSESGDISVKGVDNDFYNGGMMGYYGGKAGFPGSTLLGIYVPIECSGTSN